MAADVLCILVKSPVAGEVKTRLAPALGQAGAAVLARAFFDDTLAMARGLGWARVVVAVAGDPALLDVPAGVEVWPQGQGDLGERMEQVLTRALASAARAILVGTDSPGLPPRAVEAARQALIRGEAALGPAEDGGFYLIGLSRCEPGLLAGLPWSRGDTLAHTAARLSRAGLRVTQTEPWFDVDEPADLERLAALVEGREIDAPAASQALRSLGLLGGATA